MARRVYFAGELFKAQDLIGNTLLAEAIAEASEGRYACVLPQDLEVDRPRSQAIRDADLRALLECDLALFHFDGTELDAGTVTEYLVAKFADLPAVLLRTDLRRAGDSDRDPWNLMLGHWPRTRKLVVPALGLYAASGRDPRQMAKRLARRVVTALDHAAAAKPVVGMDQAWELLNVLPKLMGLKLTAAEKRRLRRALTRRFGA
ncbi:MAG: nucleoside 2-deoxyribosyltransferase [Verrucomicrobiota bacterium]